jgi:hypothetical protein
MAWDNLSDQCRPPPISVAALGLFSPRHNCPLWLFASGLYCQAALYTFFFNVASEEKTLYLSLCTA